MFVCTLYKISLLTDKGLLRKESIKAIHTQSVETFYSFFLLL